MPPILRSSTRKQGLGLTADGATNDVPPPVPTRRTVGRHIPPKPTSPAGIVPIFLRSSWIWVGVSEEQWKEMEEEKKKERAKRLRKKRNGGIGSEKRRRRWKKGGRKGKGVEGGRRWYKGAPGGKGGRFKRRFEW